MEIIKKTFLQKVDENIENTLDWKLAQLVEQNIPTESGICDYIALGLDGIANEVVQLKNYKNLLTNKIKELEAHGDNVKVEVAKWIQAQGLEKLEGIAVSSITVTKGKEENTEPTVKSVFETHLTQEKIEEFLIKQGLGYRIEVRSTRTNEATSTMIRVNRRRKLENNENTI